MPLAEERIAAHPANGCPRSFATSINVHPLALEIGQPDSKRNGYLLFWLSRGVSSHSNDLDIGPQSLLITLPMTERRSPSFWPSSRHYIRSKANGKQRRQDPCHRHSLRQPRRSRPFNNRRKCIKCSLPLSAAYLIILLIAPSGHGRLSSKAKCQKEKTIPGNH